MVFIGLTDGNPDEIEQRQEAEYQRQKAILEKPLGEYEKGIYPLGHWLMYKETLEAVLEWIGYKNGDRAYKEMILRRYLKEIEAS